MVSLVEIRKYLKEKGYRKYSNLDAKALRAAYDLVMAGGVPSNLELAVRPSPVRGDRKSVV